jgi:hypothetical protein
LLGCALALSACAEPHAKCTVYTAKGFSEEAFAKIEKGMTRAEVEGLIGKPQRRSRGGRLTLIYYTAPGDCPESGFPAREVALGPDDRVAWTWAGWIQEGPGGEFETEPPLDPP